MVLYHAITSYQILCMIAHKLNYHKKEKAVLILPDFIVAKYPNYMLLKRYGIFSKVILFPYLYIPHVKDQIFTNVSLAYSEKIKKDIRSFSKIYIGGAQFYFSAYLIQNEVKFEYFEEAPGMIACPDVLYRNIKTDFPIQADFAKDMMLLNGENYLIEKAFVMNPQKGNEILFNVIEEISKLRITERKKLFRFFKIKPVKVKSDSMLFLSEQFVNLGKLTQKDQIRITRYVIDKYSVAKNIIIKPHPDDNINYKEIFSDCIVIDKTYPAELLPFIFDNIPKQILTISSTAIKLIGSQFKIQTSLEYMTINEIKSHANKKYKD